ncbi:MAG: C39 family peptidase [Candidatus Falkowbacteria bacterium]
MKKSSFLFSTCLILLLGCSKKNDNLVVTKDTSHVQGSKLKSATVSSTFPGYSFCLGVPWIKQFPPGDINGTKNCGQTCAVMLSGYFNGTAVNSAAIVAEDNWLASYYNDARFNNATGNSYVTTAAQIQTLLKQRHGLTATPFNGSTVDDMLAQAYAGKPCIANVMIKAGLLATSGGAMHWTLVVGFDGTYVITNDPGTQYGFNKKYTKAEFTASWTVGNKLYMTVSK